MKIINTCDEIKASFFNGFDMKIWRKYANKISKELPPKCENDAKNYDFNKQILPVMAVALNNEKLDHVSRNFQAVIKTLNENLSKLFNKEPDINIILYLGLCNGAGWATTIDGKDTILLGVEKIIELDWGSEANMRALIFHEIGHLWHELNGKMFFPVYTKRRKALQQLYCEGVAMMCEHILCGDDEFYHQNKDDWLQWCYKNENEIKNEYLRRMNEKESVQVFFGDWCSYNGHSDVGYFLGCRFVRYMMKTYSLKEVANFSYRKLNKEFIDFTGMVIEPLKYEDYHKCSNIWNMKAQPLSEKWRDEIASGNRMVFIYKINGEFIGEGALVFDTGDPDYTIPHKRVYVSRMIVKKEYRGRGIGSDILNFLIAKAKEMGFSEMAIGVDKDNIAALNLYKKFGFTNVLFDGADEDGEYFKLMKTL